MIREATLRLTHWKHKQKRFPILLQGARQVGKTHLLRDFGRSQFTNTHYFNFEKDRSLHSAFKSSLDSTKVIGELALIQNKKIIPQSDLIIFDEIQECPSAITALKYFAEELPDSFIASAGSLLGVKLSTESFPVGKVEFLELFPLSFKEFLNALNDEHLIRLWQEGFKKSQISETAHHLLIKRLREYYFTGGMPKAVLSFIAHPNDLLSAVRETRKIQKSLLKSYQNDFAKHAGKINSMHLVSVFENVPIQLARAVEGSVQRFTFKDVIPKKKGYSDLEGPIEWLEKAGLILKTKFCHRPEMPIKAFTKDNHFKLYIFDTGLLGAALQIDAKTIFDGNMGIEKGFFVENFIAQTLRCHFEDLFSWTERNSEIEFIVQKSAQVIPIEVKSGIRTQAKSLVQYLKRYNPKEAVLFSENEPRTQGVVKKLPLYWAQLYFESLKD